MRYRNIPSIQVGQARNNSDSNPKLSTNTVLGSLVRFGKQCIVYEMHSHDDVPSKAWDIFGASESQRLSKDSYIFLNAHHDNLERAEKFLIDPRLKNYPFRVWPRMSSEFITPNNDDPLQISVDFHYFCFYCNGGSYGLGSSNKLYSMPEEITSISEIFPDVTNDLRGHTLRVTAPPAPPLVLITPSNNIPGSSEIHGQQENILYGIAGKYNFTCKLYPVPGGSTGSRLSNGTWTGVITF